MIDFVVDGFLIFCCGISKDLMDCGCVISFMSIVVVVDDEYDLYDLCVGGEDGFFFYFWFIGLVCFVWIIVGVGCLGWDFVV